MVKNKFDKRYVQSGNKMEACYLAEIKKQGIVAGVQSYKIYKGARVHASTFSRHYRNLKNLALKVRIDIKQRYFRRTKSIIKHNGTYDDIILATFDFIRQNCQYFQVAVRLDNIVIFEYIGQELWKAFYKTEYRYGMKRIKNLYIYEVIGIFVTWIRDEKLDSQKINQYKGYIIKLSEDCSQRLSFLAKED